MQWENPDGDIIVYILKLWMLETMRSTLLFALWSPS